MKLYNIEKSDAKKCDDDNPTFLKGHFIISYLWHNLQGEGKSDYIRMIMTKDFMREYILINHHYFQNWIE